MLGRNYFQRNARQVRLKVVLKEKRPLLELEENEEQPQPELENEKVEAHANSTLR